MKPLLRRHLKTKHQQYVDKPLEFFVGKKRELGPSKKKLTNTVPTKSEYIFTGLFSCGIQNSADRRIIQYCWRFILAAAKGMVSCVLGDKSLKLLDKIPVWNDTIARRIHDMAGDAENQQLTPRLKNNYFAIQVDESRDVPGLRIHLVLWDISTKIFLKKIFCYAGPRRLRNYLTAKKRKFSRWFVPDGYLDINVLIGFLKIGKFSNLVLSICQVIVYFTLV
jgi:hypothetical protein